VPFKRIYRTISFGIFSGRRVWNLGEGGGERKGKLYVILAQKVRGEEKICGNYCNEVESN
jgi:hypothetical protein